MCDIRIYKGEDSRPRLIIVMGPTAVGKTELGIELAERFCGEIVSADSMQVYRDLDIGTAKPSPEQLQRIPHHLIDVVEPTERFSAGRFKKMAREAVQDIRSRGLLPVIVGGTTMYIRSLLFDYPLAEVPRDSKLRTRLRRQAAQQGRKALHEQLACVDPDSARRIHPNDLKRVVRALEVYELTGETMTTWRKRTPDSPVYDACKIGLWLQRDRLYERIEQRVDRMLSGGLIREVRDVLQKYGDLGPTASQAVGYKETVKYLQGDIDWEECRELISKNTRNLAKRQLVWLRRDDDISWIDMTDASADEVSNSAAQLVSQWL